MGTKLLGLCKRSNGYFEDAQKHAANTKDFYKEINKKEAIFLLQDAPFEQFDKNKLKKACPGYDIYVHWHLYLGYLNWTEVEIAIEKKINELFAVKPKIFDSYRNRTNPILTPIAALTLNENMQMIDNSMVISTGAYAVGKIIREGFSENDFEDLINFENNSQRLIVNLLKESFDNVGRNNKFTLERINYISNALIKQLGVNQKFIISNPEICVRKITYRNIKTPEEVKQNKRPAPNNSHIEEDEIKDTDWASAPSLEMFNSFFLKSIDLVRTNVNNFEKGSAIAKYLGRENKPETKDVLQEKQILQHLLQPPNMQLTRWPSSPKNSLALLQAGAINSILPKTENIEHLFAVNGPPGTGKTTMLFDIIANLYVKRAVNLAKFVTPSEGFEDKIYSFKSCGFEYKIKGVHPCIRNYNMVIASSNNGAVENISAELPLHAKVDAIYHQELKFFDWLNNSTKDKGTCWGVFAAVLGNSANRRNFMDKFWNQEFVKEQENYKERTMFQYLNLLKGKKQAQSLENLKPEY